MASYRESLCCGVVNRRAYRGLAARVACSAVVDARSAAHCASWKRASAETIESCVCANGMPSCWGCARHGRGAHYAILLRRRASPRGALVAHRTSTRLRQASLRADLATSWGRGPAWMLKLVQHIDASLQTALVDLVQVGGRDGGRAQSGQRDLNQHVPVCEVAGSQAMASDSVSAD